MTSIKGTLLESGKLTIASGKSYPEDSLVKLLKMTKFIRFS